MGNPICFPFDTNELQQIVQDHRGLFNVTPAYTHILKQLLYNELKFGEFVCVCVCTVLCGEFVGNIPLINHLHTPELLHFERLNDVPVT